MGFCWWKIELNAVEIVVFVFTALTILVMYIIAFIGLSARMKRKAYNKDVDAYYCCCGCMHVLNGTLIMCILILLYCGIIDVYAWCILELNIFAVIILVIFTLALLAIYIIAFIGCYTKIVGWFITVLNFSIFFCISNNASSIVILVASLIGLCLDENKMNSIINARSEAPEKLSKM
uniref:NADH dehydrogenase subunit 6 n=1 Tax=Panagrolaimus sp. ES5 TaxID=591445 RepID=A0AC34F468_9BILA